MDEGGEAEDTKLPKPSQAQAQEKRYLEVVCTSSGETRRFADGTTAGFAVNVINSKLNSLAPRALLIEAAREEEEPVSFGPDAVLVNYGKGWKLQTVVKDGEEGEKKMEQRSNPNPRATLHNKLPIADANTSDVQSLKKLKSGSGTTVDLHYIGKISLAFLFIFLLGGTLTLFLENLPKLILFVNPAT